MTPDSLNLLGALMKVATLLIGLTLASNNELTTLYGPTPALPPNNHSCLMWPWHEGKNGQLLPQSTFDIRCQPEVG